jgi:hypothetical protein
MSDQNEINARSTGKDRRERTPMKGTRMTITDERKRMTTLFVVGGKRQFEWKLQGRPQKSCRSGEKVN